jgi:hypothetical protein
MYRMPLIKMTWMFCIVSRKPARFFWMLPFALIHESHGAIPNPMEVGFEWIDTDDISLLQTSWVGDFDSGEWETSLSLAYGKYTMDYVPVSFDFNGMETHLSERNIALGFNTQKQINQFLSLMGGAGAYDGFTNYRSVWLDEYYRQQFSDLGDFPGADSYVVANPYGINATVGARWEYKPATGFAQLNISGLMDEVSPGYEIDFDGLRRGELTLYTSAISLSTENVLSKNVRSYIAVRASETTDRSTRYGIDAALNIALGENWVGRINVGGATEDPEFEAFYGGVALERNLTDSFSCYVDLRYYEDTGEIENALLFTSAAPGLVSERYGIGFRWIADNWSARVYLAPIKTEYDPTNANTDFFQHLYSDRDWTVFQLAISRSL